MEQKQDVSPYRAEDQYGYQCTVGNCPRVRRQPSRDRTCCQTLFFFMFSHIGIGLIVITYAIIGAFAFRELEKSSTEESQNEVSQVRHGSLNEDMLLLNARVDLASALWSLTRTFNVLYEKNWTDKATGEILKFQSTVVAIVNEREFHDRVPVQAANQRTRDGKDFQWTFFNSFLYSLTVITTIGKTTFVHFK